MDLASLLSGGGNLEQLYRNEDPYYQAARGISQIQYGAPRNNTEAFLLPFLQNTIAGGLAGYGKTNANKAAYSDISSMLGGLGYPPSYSAPEGTSIAQLLGTDDIAAPLEYGLEEMPDGFSIKAAMPDLQLALASKVARQEEAAKKSLILAELDPEIANAKADFEMQVEEGKARGKLLGEGGSSQAWWKDVPAADKTKLTQARGTISALDKLAADFESLDMTAAEFQAKMDISGTKANELKSRMMTMIPNTVRLMGDVGNLADREQERVIAATLGNWTSGTEGAAQRIRNLADQSQSIVQAKLEGYKLAQTDPSSLLDRSEPTSKTVKEPISQAQAQAEARRRGLIP